MEFLAQLNKNFKLIDFLGPLLIKKGFLLFLIYLSYKPVKLLLKKFIDKILELKKIDLLLKEFIITLVEGIISRPRVVFCPSAPNLHFSQQNQRLLVRK